MTRKLDEKMLSGFSRELRGYLSNIRESIERLNTQHDAIEQVTQGLTTITGALQMIGFTALSQVTSHLRGTLEESLSDQSALDDVLRTRLGSTIGQLERNLEAILTGQLSEDTFVAEVEHSLSRYKEEGAIKETSAAKVIDTATAAQDMGSGAEGDTLYVDLDEDEHGTVPVAEGEPNSREFIEEPSGQAGVEETTPDSPLPSASFEEPQASAIDDRPPHAQPTAPDVQNVPGVTASPLLHDEPTMSKMGEVGFEEGTADRAYEDDSPVVGESQPTPEIDTPALEDEVLADRDTEDTVELMTFADSTSGVGGEQVDVFMSGSDEPTLIDEREGLGLLSTEEDENAFVDQATQIESAESMETADTLLYDLNESELSATSDFTPDVRAEEDVVAGLADILPTDTIELVLPDVLEEDANELPAEQLAISPENREMADSSPDVHLPHSAEQFDVVGGVQEHDFLPESRDVRSDDPTMSDVSIVPEPSQAPLPLTEELEASTPEYVAPDEPTLIDVAPTSSTSPAWDETQDVHAESPFDVADTYTIETPSSEGSHIIPDETVAADPFSMAIENETMSDLPVKAGDTLDAATEMGSIETVFSSDDISTHDVEAPLYSESAEDYEPCLEPPLIEPQAEEPANHFDSHVGEAESSVASCGDTVADDRDEMSVFGVSTPESDTGELPNAKTDEPFGSEPEDVYAFDEFEHTRIDDDTSRLLADPPEEDATESLVMPLPVDEEAQNTPKVTDLGETELHAIPTSLGSQSDAMDADTPEAAEWTDIPDETEPPDLSIDLLMSESDYDDDEPTGQPTSQEAALETQEPYDEYAIDAADEDEEESGEWLAAEDGLPELLFDPTEDLDEDNSGEEGFVVAPAQVPVASPPVESPTEASIPSDTSAQELSALVEAIDNEVQEVYGRSEESPEERRARGEIRSSERYLLYTLAGSRYAVGVPHVLEISRVPQLTAVPNVPEWVSGVINLRGEIISVIDLRTFLGLEKSYQLDQSRLLIVKTQDDSLTTSLIVDQINGFARIPENLIQDLTMSFQSNLDSYLVGISDYEDHVLAVFDLERFLQSSEICQFDIT